MKFTDDQMSQFRGMIVNATKEEIPPIVEQIIEKKLIPVRRDIRKIKKDARYVVDVLDRSVSELLQSYFASIIPVVRT